jgi:hypothetical protein
MESQSVTVVLPEPLYARLARRAEKSRRTVEAELADAVAALPDEAEELPQDLADSFAALQLLDEAELWRAARQCLSAEKAAAIEDLHAKRQREGLSASESESLATLMRQHTRILLVRSRSAALLKQLGCDVSTLIDANEP